MDAGPIDINHGEGKVFRPEGEGCGNREGINRVVYKFQNLIVPSRNDTTRGTLRRLKDKGTQRRWQKGRGEEVGNVGLLSFV
jgi:hypothetical protein